MKRGYLFFYRTERNGGARHQILASDRSNHYTAVARQPPRMVVWIGLMVAVMIFAPAARTSAENPAQRMFETLQNLCSTPSNVLADRCSEFDTGSEFEGLPTDQVDALRRITSDETNTMGTLTVEITGQQFASIAGRLTALRGGDVRGLSLNLNQDSLDEISHLFAGPGATSDSDSLSSSSDIGDFGRLGLFVNAAFAGGDRDRTIEEPGFNFDRWALTGGIDYRITDNAVIGGTVGYAQTEADLDDNLGDIDSDGYSGALYGSYYIGDYYIDAIVSYARKEYESVRYVNYKVESRGGDLVNQTFTGDTDADEYTFSLGGGYQFNKGGWQFGPYGRFDYLKSEIDAYSERVAEGGSADGEELALHVDEQDIESFTSVLGGQVSYALGTAIGVMTPYLRMDWVHEFASDGDNITARFLAVPESEENTIIIPVADPDRDYATLGAGLSAVFPHGVLAFVDYETVLALSDISVHQVTGGIRVEF